ncbi:MAG TPA: VCBS repeat-containing protein, partial [Bryobacteraceae bacterium]|nr:VCBS repeat-containing protein [Bryobacteraceae bacterium]
MHLDLRFVLVWGLLLCLSRGLLAGADLQPLGSVRPEYKVRGAALRGRTLFTWGNRLTSWSVPDLRPSHLTNGNFGEGGCLVDLDRNGSLEWVGQSGDSLGLLVWMAAPGWKPQRIDDEIEMHDCMEATLFGRTGVLMVNRYMQVRFYERSRGNQWRYREIYSFYTNSQQAGLTLADIDGDSFTDILCGNYWIKSPTRFDLPWRLFAINTEYYAPLAAMFRFALTGEGKLWAAQSHMERAKLTLFQKPADPRQLWPALTRPGEGLDLTRAHALAAGDWAGSSAVIVGENVAGGRLILLAGPDPKPRILARQVN